MPEPGPAAPRQSRTGMVLLIVGVVLAVLLVVGGVGAFAAYKAFFSGGARPDTVLPASTLAMVSVDLDPGAGQKVEAYRTLKKFPAYADKVGADTGDELLRRLFDEAQKSGECTNLNYQRDIEPWLGKRAAVGVVDQDADEPTPVIAVQITDQAKAEKGVTTLLACSDQGEDEDFAYEITDDYVVASDSRDHVRTIVAAAKDKPLAEDSTYQQWTEEAGGAGVMNVYVAPAAATYLAERLGGLTSMLGGSPFSESMPNPSSTVTPGIAPSLLAPEATDTPVPQAVRDFRGLAASLRFEDGGIEFSVASGTPKGMTGSKGAGEAVTELPGDTTAAVAIGLPKDFDDQVNDRFEDFGVDSQMLAQIEQQTGLQLPDDLEALAGATVSLSLGGDLPADLNRVEQPSDLPAGVVLSGDVAAFKDIVERVEQRSGGTLEDADITVDDSEDRLVMATTSEYASALTETGSLGKNELFRDVVPEADRAQVVVFVSYDGALRTAAENAMSSEDRSSVTGPGRNLAPIKGLGLSAWVDGDTSRALVRIALK